MCSEFNRNSEIAREIRPFNEMPSTILMFEANAVSGTVVAAKTIRTLYNNHCRPPELRISSACHFSRTSLTPCYSYDHLWNTNTRIDILIPINFVDQYRSTYSALQSVHGKISWVFIKLKQFFFIFIFFHSTLAADEWWSLCNCCEWVLTPPSSATSNKRETMNFQPKQRVGGSSEARPSRSTYRAIECSNTSNGVTISHIASYLFHHPHNATHLLVHCFRNKAIWNMLISWERLNELVHKH